MKELTQWAFALILFLCESSLAQPISGPASVTTNAVLTFSDPKHVKNNPGVIVTDDGRLFMMDDAENDSFGKFNVRDNSTNSIQSDWPYYEYGAVSYSRSRGSNTNGSSVAVFAFNDSSHSVKIAATAFIDSKASGETNIAGMDLVAIEGNSGKFVGRYIDVQNPGYGALPVIENAGLLIDNRSSEVPLIIARTNNGTTVFSVDSTGKATATGFKTSTFTGITTTNTIYTTGPGGVGSRTNVIVVQGGIITGWTITQ